VTADCLKLTTYFGERDRVGGRFLADRLLDIYEGQGLGVSFLMRGVEGFGVKHQLRTDRLLSLSEDLPIVAAAVDEPVRIDATLREIEGLRFDGLVTLERARMLGRGEGLAGSLDEPDSATKLTLYFGRGLRVGRRPAYEAVLARLDSGGVEGATVLVGVDGTLAGTRRRARFWSGNVDVPVMVVSVGRRATFVPLISDLRALLGDAAVTVERVRVLKRDGTMVSEPQEIPLKDPAGRERWQKLMLYSSEQTLFEGRPVHIEAVRRLRRAGASGATCLRGIWGFDGRHAPHGDKFWSVRRRVPTLTVVVDEPARTRRWFAILDELTPERGLITSEIVPAFRATGPAIRLGSLQLADRTGW